MSSISTSRWVSIRNKLGKHAHDILQMYNFSPVSVEDRAIAYAWWIGAPDPNHYQSASLWSTAFDDWYANNGHFCDEIRSFFQLQEM